MVLPSGDQSGYAVSCMRLEVRVAVPPDAGSVHRLPNRFTEIVLRSGDRARVNAEAWCSLSVAFVPPPLAGVAACKDPLPVAGPEASSATPVPASTARTSRDRI